MSVNAAISLGIGIASFVIGIIWKVVDLSMSFGRLSQRVANNEERDNEERTKSSAKFEAIYNRLATTESAAAEMEATVKSMSQTIERIENKLDRLMELGRPK